MRTLGPFGAICDSLRSVVTKLVPYHASALHKHCYYLANARNTVRGNAMDDISLSDIIEILEDVEEDVDYETEDALVDDRILDSFDILSIISALNDEFDISIPAKDVIPENFNSAAGILALVQRLLEED